VLAQLSRRIEGLVDRSRRARRAPTLPYVIGRWKQVTCNIDYHVEVDRRWAPDPPLRSSSARAGPKDQLVISRPTTGGLRAAA